jgi:sulfatase modifying factor 1
MNSISLSRRILTFAVLITFGFSLTGPVSLVPGAQAASASASAKIIKKLKKQIATLKKQLAAAMAQATPASFIEMVAVGNHGNTTDAGNTSEAGVYGSVPYTYKIGKTEVTLAQYTAFLNAVAATDTFGLYNVNMQSNLNIAGIARNGNSGSFTYSVIGAGTRPVTQVSWFDAARFCNWLHNGRPSGPQTAATTENGAYLLNGATSGVGITLNRAAKYWIPTEDEWYKAAYHQPSGQGGDTDSYWLYPTRSNSVPGNAIGALPNQANFISTAFSVTQSATYQVGQNYLTPVGSYPGSANFYGTVDQGGNVKEWNDTVISGTSRGIRGGSWADFGNILRSSDRSSFPPVSEDSNLGFRVASP